MQKNWRAIRIRILSSFLSSSPLFVHFLVWCCLFVYLFGSLFVCLRHQQHCSFNPYLLKLRFVLCPSKLPPALHLQCPLEWLIRPDWTPRGCCGDVAVAPNSIPICSHIFVRYISTRLTSSWYAISFHTSYATIADISAVSVARYADA